MDFRGLDLLVKNTTPLSEGGAKSSWNVAVVVWLNKRILEICRVTLLYCSDLGYWGVGLVLDLPCRGDAEFLQENKASVAAGS